MIENTITFSAAESRLFSLTRKIKTADSVSEDELVALRRTNRQMEAIYSLNRALEGTVSIVELYDYHHAKHLLTIRRGPTGLHLRRRSTYRAVPTRGE
jgi:hypothetical protein